MRISDWSSDVCSSDLGAVINRLGFNNRGVAAAASRLRMRGAGIVGANIGKNKDSTDDVADYLIGARRLAPLADYLVVNVSSPNTPGLRALQRRGVLGDLVTRVRQAVVEACPDGPPPVLVKIAPDLTEEDKTDIAAVALETGLAGLIVSNTRSEEHTA